MMQQDESQGRKSKGGGNKSKVMELYSPLNATPHATPQLNNPLCWLVGLLAGLIPLAFSALLGKAPDRVASLKLKTQLPINVFSDLQHFLSRATRLHPALLVRRSVCWSTCWSVTLYFFCFLRSLASLLLPKWSSDFNYGPCPPAHDLGGRVSTLVWLKLPCCLQQHAVTCSNLQQFWVLFY